MKSKNKLRQFRQIWAMPVVIGICITFGLVTALLGTGILHWLSWAAMLIPLVVLIYFILGNKLRR
ncbi:hypothetical protein [Undibacterium sp. Tian12W]|uniref:hypothetical protein n=1 Tax=Undibacterium sp. Tian12W TaxID=3413054 RepID=UPI003BF0F28D